MWISAQVSWLTASLIVVSVSSVLMGQNLGFSHFLDSAFTKMYSSTSSGYKPVREVCQLKPAYLISTVVLDVTRVVFCFLDNKYISDLQDAAFGKVRQLLAERKSAIEAIACEMCNSGNDTISGRRIIEIVDSTPKDEVCSHASSTPYIPLIWC